MMYGGDAYGGTEYGGFRGSTSGGTTVIGKAVNAAILLTKNAALRILTLAKTVLLSAKKEPDVLLTHRSPVTLSSKDDKIIL